MYVSIRSNHGIQRKGKISCVVVRQIRLMRASLITTASNAEWCTIVHVIFPQFAFKIDVFLYHEKNSVTLQVC